MKHMLLICLLLVAGLASAQDYQYKGLKNFPVSAETGKVTYDSVVAVEGKTAQELYSAAKEWVARNSGPESIIYSDSNKVVFKGLIAIDNGSSAHNFKHNYTYTGTIQFKEGKYKYELTDFKFESFYNGRPHATGLAEDDFKTYGLSRSGHQRVIEALSQEVTATIASLGSTEKETDNSKW